MAQVTLSVETYASTFSPANNAASFYRVTGRTHLRSFYRPMQGPLVLLDNQIATRAYVYNFFLSEENWMNRNNLYETIINSAPGQDMRIIPHGFAEDAIWEDVAVTLCNEPEDYMFQRLPYTPVGIEGEEAFVWTYMYDWQSWSNNNWLPNPPEVYHCTACLVCHSDFNDFLDPIETRLALHCCQHVCHRECLLKWLWAKYPNPPACPCGSEL